MKNVCANFQVSSTSGSRRNSDKLNSNMADVETKPNGTVEENGILSMYDPDDPENQKQMWRPPDIDQDMKEMDRRKRVDMIMNSQVFREELERIIESQISEGYLPANLAALQQVTELLLPNKRSSNMRSGHCVIPINDIRGVDGIRYTKIEKLLRCKLAAVYRLIDLYSWSENIYNHITVRISQDLEHFLINPFGLQYPEITASSLLKVDMQGNVIDPGTTSFTFNRAGFVLHSAVHSARPDVRCCIHIHHPSVVAVSAMKCGLLPVSQEAALIGEVSYHDYFGILVDTSERELIARDLGPVNKVMILRNHGVVVCGHTIEEALFYLHNLVLACEAQVRLMPIGLENIQMMAEDARHNVRNIITDNHAGVTGKPDGVTEDKDPAKKFKIWDLEFEAQMRMLDNAGFRTGYLYRYPLIRVELPRQKNDVEVPPSATSFAQYLEEDKWLSPLKKLIDGKKCHEKLRWVNSPNVYQKVEVLETGTNDPKKITKWVEKPDIGDNDSWVQEGSPSHSTLVKIESPHQFVPKTGDPNEFKRKQKEIKQNRMHSKITAGPQSSILEGVTWEEIKKMQEAQSDTSGEPVVLVGAASKGIIQREFQHNAMVYKTAFTKNPFDNMSDQDLEEYKKIVERKQRGEPVEDDIPEHIKPLLLEPVADHKSSSSPVQDLNTPPQSPASPCSDEEVSKSGGSVQRSLSARLSVEAAEELREKSFQRRTFSERKPKTKTSGDVTLNGEEKMRSADSGDVSVASRSSKESSPVKEVGDDSKKEKKKKKGIRTPSFLKKKKHRKEKEDKEKVAS